MSTSKVELREALAQDVLVTDATLSVELGDGRTVSVPTAWYPRLLHAREEERRHWRLIGGGVGIHWPDLDEDISVQNLLVGHGSGESQKSLGQWLAARCQKPKMA